MIGYYYLFIYYVDVYLPILQAQKLQEKQRAQAEVDQAELRRFVYKL